MIQLKHSRYLLIRVDDAGLNDETNCGVATALQALVARSVGVMACAPRFNDAAERLKALAGTISTGVHLTLNSEWSTCRWKPLLPATDVPSLVDDEGYLPRNHQLYSERPPKLDHVLAEIRAQIAAVSSTGLRPCYADEHMVFTAASPWLLDPIRDTVEKAGLTYDRPLDLARFKGNAFSMEEFSHGLEAMVPGVTLLVTHPAENGPHMQLLSQDRTPPDRVARERAAELATLTDPRLPALLAAHGIQPVCYGDLPQLLW